MTLREALQHLHAEGRIRSPYLPGMTLVCAPTDAYRLVGPDEFAYDLEHQQDYDYGEEWSIGETDWRPDLADAATVGCLLALLREATGKPGIHVAHRRGRWEVRTLPWQVWHPSEGAAITAALVQLAGEVLP